MPASSVGVVRTKYSYNKNPLPADVVVVDETSMADIFLIRSLLWAVANHVHLVVIGDSNQLNSVGPGKVLYDLTVGLDKLQKMYTIKILPKWTKLSQINRNEKDSRLTLLSKTLLMEDAEERWSLFYTELKKCMKKGDVTYFQSNDNKEIANLTVDYYLDQKNI